jgi:DNA-binding NarL/FixJ family response regulator
MARRRRVPYDLLVQSIEDPRTRRAPVIHVGVADDRPIARRGVVLAVGSAQDVVVIGEAADDIEALGLAADSSTEPNVLLLDADLPGGGGCSAARRIGERHPNVAVVMLGASDDWRHVEPAVRAGVRGYVLRSDPPAKLLETVREVAAGRDALENHRAWLSMQARPYAPGAGPAHRYPTQRQVEVLHVLGTGADDLAAARILEISPATLRAHVRRLATKLGLPDRDAVARFGAERRFLLGWIPECIGLWDRRRPGAPIERFAPDRESAALMRLDELDAGGVGSWWRRARRVLRPRRP